MDNNKNQSSKKTPKENTIRNEVTQIVSSAYKFLEDWVRPKKGQSPFCTNHRFHSKTSSLTAPIDAFSCSIGRVDAHFFDRIMSKQQKSSILFIVCSLLFVLHQILQKVVGLSFPLADNYLDPLLCMPIVLNLIVLERRFLRNRPEYTLPRSHIFGYFLLISIISELIFPIWSEQMTSDYLGRHLLCFWRVSLYYL